MPETVPERHYRVPVQSVRQLVSQLEAEHAPIPWQVYEKKGRESAHAYLK
jgi:hypothetical protein